MPAGPEIRGARGDLLLALALASTGQPAAALDAALHAARALPRRFTQRRETVAAEDVPEGTFILNETGTPALLWQGALHPFAPDGYGAPLRRPRGAVTVLTPTPSRDALRAGYVPYVALDR